MNHSKVCPFFSSQAWAASHKAQGHRLLIWQGSAQQRGRGNTFILENLACNEAFEEQHGNCPRERMASCINMLKRDKTSILSYSWGLIKTALLQILHGSFHSSPIKNKRRKEVIYCHESLQIQWKEFQQMTETKQKLTLWKPCLNTNLNCQLASEEGSWQREY